MKIGFFGCSFTEGGGLDSPFLNKWAIENNIVPKEYKIEPETILNTLLAAPNKHSIHPNCVRLKNNYRFSSLVGRELNCDTENFGVSCGSNETILNNLYKNYERFDICVVQFSLYQRMKIWDEETKRFYSVNGLDANAPQNVIDYFSTTYTQHYSESYEQYKITQLINLYDKIFESLDKKVIWMFNDPIPKNCESKNIVYFESINQFGEPFGHLQGFVQRNKLTLTDETKGFYNDIHYSLEGHKIIANKILEKINV